MLSQLQQLVTEVVPPQTTSLTKEHSLQLSQKLRGQCLLLENLCLEVQQLHTDLLAIEQFTLLVEQCYDRTARQLSTSDLPFYRKVISRLYELGVYTVSREDFANAIAELEPELGEFGLDKRLRSLVLGKIERNSCVDSIREYIGEFEGRMESRQAVFSKDPFDRLLSSQPTNKYRITSVEDFLQYLSSLQLQQPTKTLLSRKTLQFQQLLDHQQLSGLPTTISCITTSELQMISRKNSDELQHDTHVYELEGVIERLEKELESKDGKLKQTEETMRRLHEENIKLKEYLTEMREGNRGLREKERELLAELEAVRMGYEREIEGVVGRVKVLEKRCGELENQLYSERKQHQQIADRLKHFQQHASISQPSSHRRKDSNFQPLSRPISKPGSIVGTLALKDDLGMDNYQYFTSRKNTSRRNSIKDIDEVKSNLSIIQAEDIRTSTQTLSPQATQQLQRIITLNQQITEAVSQMFIQSVIVLSEEEINSTKLMCAGVKSLGIYNQDQTVFVKIRYGDIKGITLPASNLFWIVIKTVEKEVFLEMARRDELVGRLLECGVGGQFRDQQGLITGLPNNGVYIDYYARKKAICDLPRQIYNPLRYFPSLSHHFGHIYFKPNSKFTKQQYKQYFAVFINGLLLLFESSTVDSITHLIPILESTSLTPLQSREFEFYTYKLANPDFPAMSYTLGFQGVRVCEIWVAVLEGVISSVRKSNEEVRRREEEMFRMLMKRAGS